MVWGKSAAEKRLQLLQKQLKPQGIEFRPEATIGQLFKL
jgi:hypothetical protein